MKKKNLLTGIRCTMYFSLVTSVFSGISRCYRPEATNKAGFQRLYTSTPLSKVQVPSFSLEYRNGNGWRNMFLL